MKSAVNRYCFVATESEATDLARNFSVTKPEPGPYCVVEVWRDSGWLGIPTQCRTSHQSEVTPDRKKWSTCFESEKQRGEPFDVLNELGGKQWTEHSRAIRPNSSNLTRQNVRWDADPGFSDDST